MVRRFELYVRVARAISHECAQRTSEILFLPWEHKIHIFELTCIMFFLLYKHSDNGVFDDFPKISDHFPKISEDFSKLFRRPEKHSRTFSENFRKFTKMSEDCRRLPKTFEEDRKMFRWYNNEFKYNSRDKLDISEIIDIFTYEGIVSFLSICNHSYNTELLYNIMYYLIFYFSLWSKCCCCLYQEDK